MITEQVEVKINGEFICQFTSFSQWVNKAKSWIGHFGRYQQIVCIDTLGNLCFIGEDFMYARDNNLFPVKAYRLKRSVENGKP